MIYIYMVFHLSIAKIKNLQRLRIKRVTVNYSIGNFRWHTPNSTPKLWKSAAWDNRSPRQQQTGSTSPRNFRRVEEHCWKHFIFINTSHFLFLPLIYGVRLTISLKFMSTYIVTQTKYSCMTAINKLKRYKLPSMAWVEAKGNDGCGHFNAIGNYWSAHIPGTLLEVNCTANHISMQRWT